MSIIHLDNIQKSYFMGRMELKVLKGISLDILKNEYVALMGPSGSGKSTLMNILGCLDTPSDGTYILNGKVNNRASHIQQKVNGEWAPLNKGKIALQLEYAEVFYRNVEIKEQ